MTIEEFFQKNRKVAIAFSGGVDSAYLLYEAKKNNADVIAYYIKTQFQPQLELDDAFRLAKELDANMKVIELNVLEEENVVNNPANRCYYCKNRLFNTLIAAAKADGYSLILDGTNASDDVADRPGMKALVELKVCSPLRECGLTKTRIRELSKEAGLFTWDKPAYACLATRIPTGTKITSESLTRTEKAEEFMSKLGFCDFRVRTFGNSAKLQIKENQMDLLMEKRQVILEELAKYYESVTLDLKTR